MCILSNITSFQWSIFFRREWENDLSNTMAAQYCGFNKYYDFWPWDVYNTYFRQDFFILQISLTLRCTKCDPVLYQLAASFFNNYYICFRSTISPDEKWQSGRRCHEYLKDSLLFRRNLAFKLWLDLYSNLESWIIAYVNKDYANLTIILTISKK